MCEIAVSNTNRAMSMLSDLLEHADERVIGNILAAEFVDIASAGYFSRTELVEALGAALVPDNMDGLRGQVTWRGRLGVVLSVIARMKLSELLPALRELADNSHASLRGFDDGIRRAIAAVAPPS